MKCDICEKEVDKAEEMKYQFWWKTMDYWMINASVTGHANILKGHRVCLQNVDQQIVIPERIKLIQYLREADAIQR